MSTKDAPGPFDGMARALPGEPVFTLRAHDPLAPALVLEWVDRRRKAIREAHGREEITDAKRELELIQCKEAEELAWSMEAWRKGELAERAAELEAVVVKVPANYSGHVHTDEELAAKRRYDAIRTAGALMQNARTALADAANIVMPPLGLVPERALLLYVVGVVGKIADHLKPKRASYSVSDVAPPPIRVDHVLYEPATVVEEIIKELERSAADADPS